MTSKLDQSLGDIIDSNKKTERKNKPTNRSNNRSNDRSDRSNDRSTGPIRKGRGNNANRNTNTPYSRDQSINQSMRSPPPTWTPNMFIPPVSMSASSPAPAVVTQKVIGDTIHISNLDKAVTSEDLQDIFKPCGNIKNVNLHFDQTGQSIGTATITFNRKNDAAKAVDEFDGAEVDGRVMHIKLIGEVVKQTNQPKVQQAASPFGAMTPEMMQQFAAFQAAQMMQQQQQQQQRNQPLNQSNRNQPRRNDCDQRDSRPNQSANQSKRGGRNTSGRGGRRGDNSRDKKPVSAEDLDAQLDTYHTKNTASESTTAAAEPAAAE